MYGFSTVTRWTMVLLALVTQLVKVEALDRRLYNTSSMPSNCEDAINLNPMRGNGVYTIYVPHSGLIPFRVYCLEDDYSLKPWTLIQRRVSADEDFYKGWEYYKAGFGNLYTNFWLGLDKIHALTGKNTTHELWIQMTEKHTADARYSRFIVGDESTGFQLLDLGLFTGMSGDGLEYAKGQKFRTYDADGYNCAQSKHGAYWYSDCGSSNLNGIYGSASKTDGVAWDPWYNHGAMEYVHMAIRPR